MPDNPIGVELVIFGEAHKQTGIGRAVHEIYSALQAHPELLVSLNATQPPPLAARFTPLKHFPMGVQSHQKGKIVHFQQIVGSALMLWNTLRPAVGTVYDLGVLVCREDALLFNRLERWILDRQFEGLRRMDAYITTSQYTQQTMIEKLGIKEKNIYVAPCGVDHQRFRPTADARALANRKYPNLADWHGYTLLYVGSELPRKNLVPLLTAVAQLNARGIAARLLKVGGAGGERWRAAFRQQISRLKLDDKVLQMGNVADDDLPLLYNAADVFVTTSLLEGFCFPVLEAMACGTPVVCSSLSALPELVGDAAVQVNPCDVDALTEALAAVLQDSQQQAHMRQRGLERAVHYRWEKTAARYLDVYRAVGE
jgi:glycosyltransferase involved in cell wall biosynthesis